jgi:hypothetical protein
MCRPGKLLILLVRKNQMLRLTAPTARDDRLPLGKTRPPGVADFGRATPSLRQPTPGAILILTVAGLSS